MEAEAKGVIASMKKFLMELKNDYEVSPSSDDYHIRNAVIGNYSVKPEEVEGEVVNWCLQYLEPRKCPSVLTLAISKRVAEQMKEFVENENKFVGSMQNTGSEISIDAMHLHAEAIRHLHDLCDHWREDPDQLMTNVADIKEDPYFTSVCTIKNIRRKMEDRYTVIHNLNLVCGLKNAPHHSYYGVFDGHAGTRAANYAAAHLHSNIAHHPVFLSDPEVAIKEGFKITDQQILERSKNENTKSGCTVVCSFLKETALHVAWVGDSQAILVRQGIPYIITNPHKPDRQDERQRIEDLNGYVLYIGTWRVNGTLAVSRALGDPEHKPHVSAEPDVVTIPLEGNEDFFVLACDGLWDRLNPSDVASAIYSHIVEHSPNDYDEVASRLVLQAKEHGSGDNITAIIVFLKDPKELAANPKNPPPYSLQLNGSKVDSWCQGSWNGACENDNSISAQYTYHEALAECAVKPNSLGGFPKPDGIGDIYQITNYQFNPVTCEAGRSYENDESKNMCHSNTNSIMPEATAFSELPTPPIDELLASQQFVEQDKLIEITKLVSEEAEIKPSSCVTLVDSGILEQDCAQIKESDFTSQDIRVIPLSSQIDHNDELLSSDTAVEMASEIVNNAIELAVNQVMVRTSSQMSQQFDDSGLEEGPLEESDISPVSASPEFDTKHGSGLQELISINTEIPSFVESEISVQSEVICKDYDSLEGQRCENQHDDLITEYKKHPEVELNYIRSPDSLVMQINEVANSSLNDESDHNLIAFSDHNIDKAQCITSNELSAQEIVETHPQDHTGNLLEFDLLDNSSLKTSLPEQITLTPLQYREGMTEVQHTETVCYKKLNGTLEALDTASSGNAESLSPVNSTLQSPSENIKNCIPSILPTGVGQLFEQLADENKALPAALSDSLSEELQSGITPIDLVTIPDEVPEAEGVTEDSDSEKDGGWSYIQGGKTDLPKQEMPHPSASVNIKTLNVTNKKSLNKPMKKEPTKAINDARTTQLKSSTLIRKKSLPEKSNNMDKIHSGTMKATTKPTKPALMVDKTRKPSSAPSKLASQTTKSTEMSISRPKSSIAPSGRVPAPRVNNNTTLTSRTNATITSQKTTVTNVSLPKQQKHVEQRVTAAAQISNTSSSTTRTTTIIRKTAPKLQTPAVQKTAAKTNTMETGSVGSVPQPRVRAQPVKSVASSRLASKNIQDVKQVKESTNKQISSQPSSLPKTKMPVMAKKPPVSQNSLPSRVQVSSKPTTSKQPTGPPKLPLAKSQKPPSASKPTVKSRVTTVNAAKATVSKTAKDIQKPTEKPSEQEKGTKEELTKEIVAEVVHLSEECMLKKENVESHTMEAELENEAIQK